MALKTFSEIRPSKDYKAHGDASDIELHISELPDIEDGETYFHIAYPSHDKHRALTRYGYLRKFLDEGRYDADLWVYVNKLIVPESQKYAARSAELTNSRPRCVVVDYDNQPTDSLESFLQALQASNKPLPKRLIQTSPNGFHAVYELPVEQWPKDAVKQLYAMLAGANWHIEDSSSLSKVGIDEAYSRQPDYIHKYRIPGSVNSKHVMPDGSFWVCKGWRNPTYNHTLVLDAVAEYTMECFDRPETAKGIRSHKLKTAKQERAIAAKDTVREYKKDFLNYLKTPAHKLPIFKDFQIFVYSETNNFTLKGNPVGTAIQRAFEFESWLINRKKTRPGRQPKNPEYQPMIRARIVKAHEGFIKWAIQHALLMAVRDDIIIQGVDWAMKYGIEHKHIDTLINSFLKKGYWVKTAESRYISPNNKLNRSARYKAGPALLDLIKKTRDAHPFHDHDMFMPNTKASADFLTEKATELATPYVPNETHSVVLNDVRSLTLLGWSQEETLAFILRKYDKRSDHWKKRIRESQIKSIIRNWSKKFELYGKKAMRITPYELMQIKIDADKQRDLARYLGL